MELQADIDLIRSSNKKIKSVNALQSLENLTLKYEPKDSATQVDLTEKLLKSTPSPNEDPVTWFNEVCDLREQVLNNGLTMSDDSFIRKITKNLPNKLYRTSN